MVRVGVVLSDPTAGERARFVFHGAAVGGGDAVAGFVGGGGSGVGRWWFGWFCHFDVFVFVFVVALWCCGVVVFCFVEVL